MILIEDINERIENVFSREGLATRCIFLSPDEDGPIEIVFPFGREAELFRIASKHRETLERHIGSTKRFLPRTVLFHYSYEVFGSIPLPSGYFVSSNLKNLKEPTLTEVAISEVQSPLSSDLWKAQVLSYWIDLVFVGLENPEVTEVIRRFATAVQARAVLVNQQSRFLKISKLRLAHTSSRFSAPAEFQFQNII